MDAPVVGHRQQMLGRVDQRPGDAEHLAEHVGRAARQAGERGGGAEQAVGGLVDGAVPAEGDHHVVALVGGLAAELGRMAAGLGVAGVDLEAAAQGVDDEVAQAVGDRRGVGVDDDQHALLWQGLPEVEGVLALLGIAVLGAVGPEPGSLRVPPRGGGNRGHRPAYTVARKSVTSGGQS